MSEVDVYVHTRNALGEAPLWCTSQRTLYWLDIGCRTLYARRDDDPTLCSWQLPDYAGCIAEVDSDTMALAMSEGVHLLDLRSGDTRLVYRAQGLKSGVRFNDGRVDPRGRFWAGTMQNNFGPCGEHIPVERFDGALYCFGGDDQPQPVEQDIGIANTLAWSPEGHLLYFADSLRGQIFVYDFDVDTGTVRNKRLFFEMAEFGVPDGSAMDTQGCLWNVRYGAGLLVRITPQGAVDRIVRLPVTLPTSCTFGGAALDTLYVTSASSGLNALELEAAPLSGSVLAVRDVGRGMPVPRFKVP